MNTDFNVIPMLVFLQKDTNIVEKFYFNQVVGIVTSGIVLDETGVTYSVNYGCNSEGKQLVGVDTTTGNPIYDTDCYISNEEVGSNNQRLIKINKEQSDVLEFNSENMPSNNPIIGWGYDNNQNKFFDPNPPADGYILNETTLEWEPDPEKIFDLHGDGKYYRYDSENNLWHLV